MQGGGAGVRTIVVFQCPSYLSTGPVLPGTSGGQDETALLDLPCVDRLRLLWVCLLACALRSPSQPAHSKEAVESECLHRHRCAQRRGKPSCEDRESLPPRLPAGSASGCHRFGRIHGPNCFDTSRAGG